MKKLAPLTFILSALFLAGCSGDTEADSAPSEPVTAEVQPAQNQPEDTEDADQPASIGHRTAEPMAEAHYMEIFADGGTGASLSEEEQLYTGYRICEHLLHGEILPPSERDAVDEAGIAREVVEIDGEGIISAKLYLIDRIGDRLNAHDHDVMMFAAAWSLCPAAQDQLTDEAKNTRPFSLYDGY